MTNPADEKTCVTVESLQMYEAVCHHTGCTWRQKHRLPSTAMSDASVHEREWHGRALFNEEAAEKWEAQLARLIAAARKIHDGPLCGYHPTHLGGCIGVLSEPSCACGLADLRFAIMAPGGE
jgi:hypothetical protein